MKTLLILLLLSLSACNSAPEQADVLYTNGKVYTVDSEQPWAQAFAVKGNRYIVKDDAGHPTGVLRETAANWACEIALEDQPRGATRRSNHQKSSALNWRRRSRPLPWVAPMRRGGKR